MHGRGGPSANLVGVNCNWFSKKLLVLFLSSAVSHSLTHSCLCCVRTSWTHVKEGLTEAIHLTTQTSSPTDAINSCPHEQARFRYKWVCVCVCVHARGRCTSFHRCLEGSYLDIILPPGHILLYDLQTALCLESYPESFWVLQPAVWRKSMNEHTAKISPNTLQRCTYKSWEGSENG
jgi:hypothetical protein